MSTWRVTIRGTGIFQDVVGVQYAQPAFDVARPLLAAKAGRPDLRFEECEYRELPLPKAAPDLHLGARA